MWEDDMTQKEFAETYSETSLKVIATTIASEIVIRDYVNGSSRDTRRASTEYESAVILRIAYAAMVAYSHRESADINSILDMAEFALHQFIPEANGYDTIYIPLRKITGTW